MRRAPSAWPLLLSLLALFLAPAADAQANETDDGMPFDIPAPIRWAMDGPAEAAVAVALGASLGALVAVFSFLGGEVPGTPGAKDLKERKAALVAERQDLQRRLDAEGEDRESLARLVGDVRDRERERERDRRLQQAQASVLYLVVGLVGAFVLADNMWEAIALGLAGPAGVALLLKRRADSALDALAARAGEDAQQLKAQAQAETENDDAGSTPPTGAPAAEAHGCCCCCRCCGPAENAKKDASREPKEMPAKFSLLGRTGKPKADAPAPDAPEAAALHIHMPPTAPPAAPARPRISKAERLANEAARLEAYARELRRK